MAKPWIVLNAQGEIVIRLEGSASGPIGMPSHLEEAANAGLLICQYRPRRGRGKTKQFPYNGNGRL